MFEDNSSAIRFKVICLPAPEASSVFAKNSAKFFSLQIFEASFLDFRIFKVNFFSGTEQIRKVSKRPKFRS